MSDSKNDGAMSAEFLAGLREAFAGDVRCQLAVNALADKPVADVATSRRVLAEHDHQFTDRIPAEAKITNQKSSGRCWLFAFLNTVRLPLMAELKLDDDFELSQTYLFYWDKFEKSNYFLENVLQTLDQPVDGRLISHLLTTPVNDGGQYDMIINLVEKYGLVPKAAFPDTYAATASRYMNGLVTLRLRQFCMELRQAHEAGKPLAELRKLKDTQLAEIHRIITSMLGEPPAKFDWTYRNKDKKTTKHADLTPKEFYEKFVRKHMDVTQQVSLINDPRNEYYKLYTVDYLGNVAGGRPVLYINVPADVLSSLTVKTIQAGRAVWFGCDVGKFLHRSKGVLDTRIFTLDALYGSDFKAFNKRERLLYGASLMTHAMVFTGVDIKGGAVERYRVENSWGTASGNNGYLSMSQEWFDQYMYQIVLPKGDLSAELTAVLEQEPVRLPAWDPMGSLAGGNDDE